MNIAFWNVRGIATDGKIPMLEKIISQYDIKKIFVLEHKNNIINLEYYAEALGLPKFAHGEPYNKHIWFFWDESITISSIRPHSQVISCNASYAGITTQISAVYASNDIKIRRSP